MFKTLNTTFVIASDNVAISSEGSSARPVGLLRYSNDKFIYT
ncbi:hypothetical protein SAMN05216464_102682 [Mucilaginibacter pineti]|uniref:Uncharacterized protein n=1 Tax=Mucilaginibacter pineti TaxID=1391627 RepID=A0A1G6XVY1_9SPHI|nr:hypothetical protein SAMN05216464_102682 [Mucilaginibacter pineti]